MLSLQKEKIKILIFRVGNIGDLICSLPAIRDIRTHFPKAQITLLSSPGAYGSPGAQDFLSPQEDLFDNEHIGGHVLRGGPGNLIR